MNKVTPSTSELIAVAGNFRSATPITPSDTTVVAFDAIYVGGTGAVAVDMELSGTAVTFSAVPVGSILPVAVTKVLAATTATLLIGLNY